MQQLAAANSSGNTAQLKQLTSGTGQLQSGAQRSLIKALLRIQQALGN